MINLLLIHSFDYDKHLNICINANDIDCFRVLLTLFVFLCVLCMAVMANRFFFFVLFVLVIVFLICDEKLWCGMRVIESMGWSCLIIGWLNCLFRWDLFMYAICVWVNSFLLFFSVIIIIFLHLSVSIQLICVLCCSSNVRSDLSHWTLNIWVICNYFVIMCIFN